MSGRRDIMSLLAGVGFTALVLTSYRGWCLVLDGMVAVKSPSLAQHATGDGQARPAVKIPDPPRELSDPASVELTPLEAAIVQVESGGDLRAIGDGGLAIGPFQIWPIMVSDANRIVGYQKWKDEDRWDLQKSVEIFRTYVRHYFLNGTDEQIARGWNGGPRGPEKPATKAYWVKVKAAMDAEVSKH